MALSAVFAEWEGIGLCLKIAEHTMADLKGKWRSKYHLIFACNYYMGGTQVGIYPQVSPTLILVGRVLRGYMYIIIMGWNYTFSV